MQKRGRDYINARLVVKRSVAFIGFWGVLGYPLRLFSTAHLFMRRQDFSYDLPDDLIAYAPCPERTQSRLLCLDGVSGQMQHQQFSDLLAHVKPGDLMVFNNTRVIAARLFATKETGGKVEVLVERIVSAHSVLAHVRSSKSPKAGGRLLLENGLVITVTGRRDALFELNFAEARVLEVLDDIGHMPLPPYIDRDDVAEDRERYQTVYGTEQGAVAAPTAGLHFDEAMLEAIKQKGVEIAYVTLHVGAGTFQPMRADEVGDHVMHSEWMRVEPSVVEAVKQTRERGGRVIAVGTTSVRSLESAATFSPSGALAPYEGETDIFIYPGYEFTVVDALVTNFHLSESTLMMLVSAFSGYARIRTAYQEAISRRYRFFSYGDAMFLTKNPRAPLEKIEDQQS